MQEIRKEELKGRLFEIANSSSSTADRCCLQQVLALLEKYEMCMEEGSSNMVMQDRPTGVIKLDCILTIYRISHFSLAQSLARRQTVLTRGFSWIS
jgi:hypothetical protein